jgi:hypothetical protein
MKYFNSLSSGSNCFLSLLKKIYFCKTYGYNKGKKCSLFLLLLDNWIRDPAWKKARSRIRDKHFGSGRNIPDSGINIPDLE